MGSSVSNQASVMFLTGQQIAKCLAVLPTWSQLTSHQSYACMMVTEIPPASSVASCHIEICLDIPFLTWSNRLAKKPKPASDSSWQISLLATRTRGPWKWLTLQSLGELRMHLFAKTFSGLHGNQVDHRPRDVVRNQEQHAGKRREKSLGWDTRKLEHLQMQPFKIKTSLQKPFKPRI